MKRLEKKMIGHMREAIANYHTNPPLARENFYTSHYLFADHAGKWSEAFAALQQQMYKIWCAYTPQPVGHYRTTHIEIGYTAHPITRWVNDNVQPPIPTTEELLSRFDQLISKYACAQEAA